MEKDSTKNSEEIAEYVNEQLDVRLTESSERRKERQKRVRRNCAQTRALLKEEQHFWVQQLDGVADKYPYKMILDIFVRVNSGGTKLDAGDLMFAAMKEGWADVEEKVEEIAEMLSDGKLEIDKSFVLTVNVSLLRMIKKQNCRQRNFLRHPARNCLIESSSSGQSPKRPFFNCGISFRMIYAYFLRP
jgi:hypothetical protein